MRNPESLESVSMTRSSSRTLDFRVLGRYRLVKKVPAITPYHIPASRRDAIASALVSLEERMNVLAKPDDGTSPHGLVSLSVQIFLCGLDDVHGEASPS
jgi:hypothetical protein